MRPPFYRLVVELSEDQAHRLGALLETEETPSYAFYDSGSAWCVEILFEGSPDTDQTDAFERLVRSVGAAAAQVRLEPVPDLDWLAENRRDFTPFSVGRFFLHGSHQPAACPGGAIAIELDAGLAFGTGRHASTFLCLEVIGRLARQRRVRHVLDIGTGSGILAIAAAHVWPAKVLATDVDPVAVAVARDNARCNRVAARIAFRRCDGPPRGPGRYDLVLANILAGPLEAMARDIATVTEPGGTVVLSGLLDAQVAGILSRYRSVGLVLDTRHSRDGWSALVLSR